MTELTDVEAHVLRTLRFNDQQDNPDGLNALALAAVSRDNGDPSTVPIGEIDRILRDLRLRGLARGYKKRDPDRPSRSKSRKYRLTTEGRAALDGR